jgi:hypothetical protein
VAREKIVCVGTCWWLALHAQSKSTALVGVITRSPRHSAAKKKSLDWQRCTHRGRGTQMGRLGRLGRLDQLGHRDQQPEGRDRVGAGGGAEGVAAATAAAAAAIPSKRDSSSVHADAVLQRRHSPGQGSPNGAAERGCGCWLKQRGIGPGNGPVTQGQAPVFDWTVGRAAAWALDRTSCPVQERWAWCSGATRRALVCVDGSVCLVTLDARRSTLAAGRWTLDGQRRLAMAAGVGQGRP